MTGTKGEILALLKRNGGHSVAELAKSLNLASITVRQHLTHLQRDGLVTVQQRANGNGRPHFVFRLTAKAHAAAFPRRSDRLVELLVNEIGSVAGEELSGRSREEKISLVLRRLAGRLAAEYAPLLRGWPLQERVAFVTEIMHSDGGFAEWEATARGYEIRDFNCLFHRLLSGERDGRACEWHRSFLTQALGTAVRVTPCGDDNEHCCRFLVEAPAPSSAG